jgi:hypothetical protein
MTEERRVKDMCVTSSKADDSHSNQAVTIPSLIMLCSCNNLGINSLGRRIKLLAILLTMPYKTSLKIAFVILFTAHCKTS